MKKRRILMGKTHLIAGAVMLAVAGGQLSAQTVASRSVLFSVTLKFLLFVLDASASWMRLMSRRVSTWRICS